MNVLDELVPLIDNGGTRSGRERRRKRRLELNRDRRRHRDRRSGADRRRSANARRHSGVERRTVFTEATGSD